MPVLVLLVGCLDTPAMLPLAIPSDDNAEVREPTPPPPEPTVDPGPTLEGLCDLSGGVVVAERWLLGVDDEANVLHVFDLSQGGARRPPLALEKLVPALAGKEADLEGAALVGDRLWLVASHDSGKDTERKEARQRLVAFDVAARPDGVTLTPVGHSDQLIAKGQYTNQLYGIVSNTEGKTSKDPGGLSIEGLAAGPDGSLLVGFRAPIHADKALVQRLDNPDGLLAGDEPTFTGPRWLDLGGRGIRSMEADGDGWLIVAGAAGSGSDFALFRWVGFDDGSPAQQLPVDVGDLRPEGLTRHGDRWWLLSDDGGLEVDGTECKKLPAAQRRARTGSFTL